MTRFRVVQTAGRLILVASFALLALHSTPATACPRCFGASDSNSLIAYLATGAVLSFLPLAIIGTVGFVIYRQSKRNSSVNPDQKD